MKHSRIHIVLTIIDFVNKIIFVCRTHLQDLKEVTAQVHYELYRHERLETLKELPLDSVSSAPASPIGVQTNHKNTDQHNHTPVKPSPKSTPKNIPTAKVLNNQPQQTISESKI